MREIKFRIYDKTEKKMKLLDSIWNMPDPSYDFDEIQQFTGLFDKSGKEIYERDIVKYTRHDDYLMDSFVKKVLWNNELATFGLLSDSGFILPFSDHSELDIDVLPHLEVIGNIYENPELLPL